MKTEDRTHSLIELSLIDAKIHSERIALTIDEIYFLFEEITKERYFKLKTKPVSISTFKTKVRELAKKGTLKEGRKNGNSKTYYYYKKKEKENK